MCAHIVIEHVGMGVQVAPRKGGWREHYVPRRHGFSEKHSLCLNVSPCTRTIGSYPTSLRYCTICGVTGSPNLEGRVAAPL